MGARLEMVVRGERVVLEDGVAPLDIGIRGGSIVALGAVGTLAGEEVIEAGSRYVLPGGIDTHTHIQWPIGDGASRDSFETATAHAAAAGTTTVIDFVPPKQGDSHLAAAKDRLASAEGRSAIDYGFHPILTDASERTLAEIPELVRLGLSSFKIYTTIDELRLDDGQILDVMRAISRAGGLPGFHAENHELITRSTDLVAAGPGPAIANFEPSRPGLAEAAAIELTALYARDLGSPLFIFHVTGREAIAAVARARGMGVQVRAETCTHYLLLDESVYARPNGWQYVITPPLRTPADRDALWSALADGPLSSVASDHCAYASDDKRPGWEDFRRMPAGAPGIEHRMPVVWSVGVSGGFIDPVQYASITATGPARTFGLYPRKGRIAVGSDADLVVLDPERTWEVGASTWGSDYEPYQGVSGVGAVDLTIARGAVVARDGEYVGDLGGRYVPRVIDTSLWR